MGRPMKHGTLSPLSVLVVATLSSVCRSQSIVQSVLNTFGWPAAAAPAANAAVPEERPAIEANRPTLSNSPAVEDVRKAAHELNPTPAKAEVPWKQGVARMVAGQNVSKAGNSYEQHKESKVLEDQVNDLKHAQGALGFLEERAANKLNADIDEVDHLIVRRHLLTDKHAENEKDIDTVEKNMEALRKVAANLATTGNAEEEAAVNHEVSDLTFAASSLRGTAGEVQELSHEIEATTADGRKMDKQVRHLARERAAIGRQVRVLTQEGDELRDSEETAQDFEAFEKAGYDGIDDKDDPYLKEAAEAMERASGWDKETLDSEAVKRREIMTKGMSANPGQAVKALKEMKKVRAR